MGQLKKIRPGKWGAGFVTTAIAAWLVGGAALPALAAEGDASAAHGKFLGGKY